MVGLLRFGRFAAVGGCATLLHVAVAWTSLTWAGLSMVFANALAFCVATAFSFAANTFWSFSSQPNGRNLTRYLVVALFCLTITIAVSSLAERLALPPMLGIALVIIVVTPLGYSLHSRFTYATTAAGRARIRSL